MADIFISYTSSDRDWAFWIGQELRSLGHVPHVHEWEIPGGGDIPAWMEQRLQKAAHVLCVISKAYLGAPYSSWERRAAQWAAQDKRPNFALPVFIEECEAPALLALLKRCDLYGISEEKARARLATYLAPATEPLEPTRFPGKAEPVRASIPPYEAVSFPGSDSTQKALNNFSTPSRSPSVPYSSSPALPPFPVDLPPIAAKANDLEAIRKAVDDAAPVATGLWVLYLSVLFYLAITAGVVTHADLFLEIPVKLPFFNIEVPLLSFFLLAPIFFPILHASTLVYLVALTDKVKRFDRALYDQMGDDYSLSKEQAERRKAISEGLRRQLPSNIFVQFLAGPANVRYGALGWLLRVIAWTTLVVAPVLLLLVIQIQFLPFHNLFITWTQRFALLIDLVLVFWLWRRILSSGEINGRHRRLAWAWSALGFALSTCAVLFSWTTATFPGEWQENHLPELRLFPTTNQGSGPPQDVSFHDWAFDGPVDPWTGRRRSPFSSTLVLTGFNIYEGLNIDDPDRLKDRDFVFRARGRDLRGAIFDRAVLSRVDFEGANLQGASLDHAQLQGASLEKANLQGTNFFLAQLQGAQLQQAQLQSAAFAGAQLQAADLTNALLQGAWLEGAELQGASLAGAQLQGGSLGQAQLQGATFDNAQLQGATLVLAQLQGASFQFASFEATDLSYTLLWRSNGGAPSTIYAAHVASIRLADGSETWDPVWWAHGKIQPWNDEAYQALLKTIKSVPPGDLHDQAFDRLRRLDCSNPDPMIVSCDPALSSPPDVAAWRKSVEDARVDDATYTKALAAALKTLLCSDSEDAVFVLRGFLAQPLGVGYVPIFKATYTSNRLEAAGTEAPGLIDFIMGKDCPVSASLTEDDKAKLLWIKQDAIKKARG